MSFSQIASGAVLLVSDAASIIAMFQGPKWGIFSPGGQPVVTGSVTSVAYRKGYRVASYPVEPGGFRNYNKVEEPYEVRVQFAVDGSTALGSYLIGPVAAVAVRHSVLQAIEAALSVTDLFAVVTPEFIYTSANLVHFDYERKARGAVSMILLEIGVQQIRIAPAAAFSNANVAKASGADPVDGGPVQPTTPTTEEQKALPTPPTPSPSPQRQIAI